MGVSAIIMARMIRTTLVKEAVSSTFCHKSIYIYDGSDKQDDEGLAEASSVAKTTAAPEPSTTTSSKKAAEKTGADKISTKTTIPPTSSTTSSDQPNATPSTPFAPTTCSEGQSTQCCDDNPCTDVDQEGGLSLTECQWQPASSYYYCAYTCTNEGYSMLVANSQATCSQISSDPAKSSGSGSSGLEDQETVITTTDINGDTTVVTTDEDNTGEAGGTGASNKIATAGFTQWFTSCSEAADCSGSFANIQSDCVSSTCSYSCSAGALSECTPGGKSFASFLSSQADRSFRGYASKLCGSSCRRRRTVGDLCNYVFGWIPY